MRLKNQRSAAYSCPKAYDLNLAHSEFHKSEERGTCGTAAQARKMTEEARSEKQQRINNLLQKAHHQIQTDAREAETFSWVTPHTDMDATELKEVAALLQADGFTVEIEEMGFLSIDWGT